MEDNLEIREKPTPEKNKCIIVGSAIEEKYKLFINYLTIAKAMKHGLKDTINEVGGLLIGNIYTDKRIDENFLYVDIKTILPIARVGIEKKFSFSEEELEKLKKEAGEKYPEDMVVGWYHSHPGWGIELSEEDQENHITFFNQPWNILLLVESVSKDFAVFNTNVDNQEAIPSKGYVLYCDNNDDIPKMKKLYEMVEQNRDRKKDRETKPADSEEEIEEEYIEIEEPDGLYLNFLHPKVVITILSSIVVFLIIVLVVGIYQMTELKKKFNYTKGSFTIETIDTEQNTKDILMKCDFINEAVKIVTSQSEEEKDKWKIREIYIKKGPEPFQLVARLEAPTPVPISQETAGETPVTQDKTPSSEGTPGTEPTKSAGTITATPEAETTPGEVSPTPEATSSTTSTGDDEAVKEKVKGWLDSWRAGDVEKFKAFYSSDFSNSKVSSLSDWMDKKISDKVFDGKPQIDIVGEITTEQVSDGRIEVKFEQYFNGTFVSSGYKTLVFTKKNNDWVISSEEFQYK